MQIFFTISPIIPTFRKYYALCYIHLNYRHFHICKHNRAVTEVLPHFFYTLPFLKMLGY